MAVVYTSEGIMKTMKIVQNGQEFTSSQSVANLHLEEDGNKLILYVPEQQQRREIRYLQQLPRRLVAYMGISDPAAVTVVAQIMNSSSLAVVNALLTDAGIVEVDGLNSPPDIVEDLTKSDDVGLGRSTMAESPSNRLDTPSRTASPFQFASNTSSSNYRFRAKQTRNRFSRTPSPNPSVSLPQRGIVVSPVLVTDYSD
jgi:hypothetical protein